MSIIVFQHNDEVGPGRLGATLRDHGFRLDIRRPDRDGIDAIPVDLDDVHAVVSLGGSQTVASGDAWIAREMEFIRHCHEAQLPVIGICLGCQFVAQALGGRCERMGTPEVGFTTVKITRTGQTDTIMAGIAWESSQFQAHGWQVADLPPGATLLASSEQCGVQAFSVGLRTFGFQYHFECDVPLIETIIRRIDDLLEQAGMTATEVTAQVDDHYQSFARLADRLCVNLATYAFPLATKLV